jgi:hypothetical protein
MTTTSSTTDKALARITALRDKARGTDNTHEAETFMAHALKLCTKHGIDAAILDEPTKQMKKPIIDGSAPTEKRYSCRFGCGLFVTHTIDEVNACAEKARNANNGNAYTAPRDPFADFFGKPAGNHRTYSDTTAQPKPRTNSSHKYCDHEATKADRAKCRKARGY